jgi:hypothetical protein
MLAATCFGSSLPSSGSSWIRLGYVKNTDRYGGLSYNVIKWPVCRSVEVQSVVPPSGTVCLRQHDVLYRRTDLFQIDI